MAEALAEKKTFSFELTTKLDGIADALPKDFNKARFVQNAVALVNEKPELVRDFGQNQVMVGLMRGSVLGLDFQQKECYLVGYGKQLNFQTSYIGQQKLLKKYAIRPVKDIYADVVREDDEFSTQIIDNQKSITFKPKPFSNKPVIGAFAVCEYVDGGIDIETMSFEELEAVRKASKMGNAGAWKTWTTEMQKKSVIRRLCKKIEIDFENPTQRQYFEEETNIETDVAEISKKEIKENANSIDFDEEVDGSSLPPFMRD